MSEGELDSYACHLKMLANNAIESCDTELLKNYIDLLDSENFPNFDTTLLINLYVEDIFEKLGPLKFPCVANWTVKYMKEKCLEYFNFPVKHQVLLVNSVVLNDEQTLISAGIRKSGDVLCLFLNRPNLKTTKSEENNAKPGLLSANYQVPLINSNFQNESTT